MTKFNFKTYKSTATRNAELAFDKMSKRVAPSPFFNDTDNIIKKAVDKYDAAGGLLSVEFKETIDKYYFIQCKKGYSFALRDLSHKALLLALSISDNLQQDSNLHKLNVDYQCMFLNVQPVTLDDLIKELVSKEVISRTTISGLYIVNHNIFFNGDKTKFIKEYKGLYGDKPVFKDKRGRVVLTGSSIEEEIRKEKEKMSNR